jgi:serine/threonine protein kinase
MEMTTPPREGARDSPEHGQMFGPYRLGRLLGRGGMGEVFHAFDTEQNRVVAIKRLLPSIATSEGVVTRFRREAEMVARLREPHVIPIHSYGEIDGQLYIDMRLVEGQDLSRLLADGPVKSPADAVDVVAQVADALDAAHAEGLVHRDVKPSNVLITDRGFAYLVDFGIARAVGSDQTALTSTGQAIGTWAYMAPERFSSQPTDHRVDVYALACILYESLTGLCPFPTNDLTSAVGAHLNTPPPKVSDSRPEAPAGLDAVIAKGMAKEPALRYDSAGDLATAAHAALSTQPVTGRSSNPLTAAAALPDRTPRLMAPTYVPDARSAPIRRPVTAYQQPTSLTEWLAFYRPALAGFLGAALLIAATAQSIDRFVLGDSARTNFWSIELVVTIALSAVLIVTALCMFSQRFTRLAPQGFLIGNVYTVVIWLATLVAVPTDGEYWLRWTFKTTMSLAFALATLCVVADPDRWCIPDRSVAGRAAIVITAGAIIPSVGLFAPVVLILMVIPYIALVCCARGRLRWGILAGLTSTATLLSVMTLARHGAGDIVALGISLVTVGLAITTVLNGRRVFSTSLAPL